ncbi:MAG: helix-turn-helix domain-containing protein [Vicinamibacterales bacterium]
MEDAPGPTLRGLREAAGIHTLEQAADRTGLDYTTIGKLENGKVPNPRIGTFERLAGAYGCDVADVLAAWKRSLAEAA